MTKRNNIIDIGDGVYVSETALRTRKREILRKLVDDAIRKELTSVDIEGIVAEMVRGELDKTEGAARRRIACHISSDTRRRIDRLSEDIIDQSVNEMILTELGKAGLEREANVLVWAAIQNMRKATMHTD
jgi:hypothetical protein